MDDFKFNTLALEDKAEFVKREGKFIDVQDYYSYRILLYSMDNHSVELLYDNTSDCLISVEFTEDKNLNTYLESHLDEDLAL